MSNARNLSQLVATTTKLQVTAGTATTAAIIIGSGVTLTTPTLGAIEYDGNIQYFTPNITFGRGLIPTMGYYRLNSGLTGANSTAVQLPFGVSVTLAASTIYEFESYFVLTKSSGTGSHTFSTGFTGTATVNNIISETEYFISTTSLPPFTMNGNSGNVVYGPSVSYSDKLTWTGSLTAATITHSVLVKGTVSIANGGSFSPYYQLSGAPGTGYTTSAGSYYRIYPIGASGSNISIGTWA